MENNQIEARIVNMLSEQLHVEVPSPDADLLDTGLLDSLKLVSLLTHLEQEFDIQISLEDLEIDDLRTVQTIGSFVTRKQ